jgi:cell division protein FtsW
MNQTRKHHQDYWLSLAVFALITFGLIMIYSVSKYYSLQITNEATDKYYLIKQLQWLGVGVVVWAIFQNIDYRFWQKKSSLMFYLTFILLLLPLLPFGHGGSGTRWFGFGIVQFQPSEVAKLTLILYLSNWFSNKGDSLKEIGKLFIPFICIISIIALLMLVQKDLGTLAVIVSIAAAMFIAAGAPFYQLISGGGLAAFLLWLSIKIEPYRMERFLTFLNPESNNLGSSYHIQNALIAIGSGGLWGLGFGQSKQKYLYLPEAHTDSIFAIICEELGLLRSSLVIIVFALIALRGYKIALKAPDSFARLAAVGITTWILAQMLINLGAMLSLLPLTGVPLPFVSYGGSSLVILLAAVGILVNISKSQLSTTTSSISNKKR